MFVSPTNAKRFNLYHMEESQIYIQDFYGYCIFYDLNTNQKKVKDKGKFYICSKSIVYESDSKNISLYKFRYQSLKGLPTFTAQSFKFAIGRITTIKVFANHPPQPFKVFQDLNEIIQIIPSYENVRNIQDWILFLYENIKRKNNYDMEQKIYELIIQKYNKKQFNKSLIDSVSEKPMIQQSNILAKLILPLNNIQGYFFITDEKVYFQPFHNLAGNSVDKIQIQKIQKLFKRRYELREIGLQIITDKSYYFTFDNENYRKKIYDTISKRVPNNCVKIDQLQNITLMWQTKQISNYEYLMHLNQAGNRSFSDLSQYPVFPWVLCNFITQQIDLTDQKNYRDLSKPIGALNQDRLQNFLIRYEGMQNPKFMYGSHYSTPGYVIGYLVRKKPQYMLKLQSGRFDKPDRLFKSIKDDWINVMQNPTSLKQLIPQFYQNDPLFLKNYQNLDLGVRQNKKRVGDVKLPLWAKEDPNLFLKIMRQALQSDYVSKNLHKWIDLIFGYKQRGQQAIKAFNLFHPLAYEGMVNIQQITDPIQKMGLKCQINEFGQCPKQIFRIPHPSRDSHKPVFSELLLSQNFQSKEEEQDDEKEEEVQRFVTAPVKANNVKNIEASGLYTNGIPKVKTVLSMGKQADIKQDVIPKAHKSQIVRAIHMTGKANTLLTIGSDGFLKIFDIIQKTCTKSFKICDFHLSCIAILKQDETFAIGSWDNNIYLFNIVYGSRSKPYPAHDNSINDCLYMKKRKRLVSVSWDCSIKMFRYVGNVLDNQEQFFDHQNQIISVAVNNDENILAFGDIEGTVICLSIDQKEQLYTINMNSQKITRLSFLQSNLIASAQSQIRLLDISGSLITSHFIDKNNGQIGDTLLDGQHLIIATSAKQIILFDILQQKKVGNFYNDFTFSQKDKLPDEKGFSCIAVGNDGLFIAVCGQSGNIYILRS